MAQGSGAQLVSNHYCRADKASGKQPGRLRLSRLLLAACLLALACTTQKKGLTDALPASPVQSPALSGAHLGICVYDPSARQYVYRYQDEKYFVPASNTKLITLYIGLKNLGDSLPGIYYRETDTAIFLLPAGDPSFLHPDYSDQPVFRFLRNKNKKIYVADANWQSAPLGSGWSWDDYNDDYMVERSSLPVYGNLLRWIQDYPAETGKEDLSPSIYSIPEQDWKIKFNADTAARNFFVKRSYGENIFEITQGLERHKEQNVPFITNGTASAIALLRDTLGPDIFPLGARPGISWVKGSFQAVYSRPLDSLFRPLMFRSDNFFAEQTLMMVSQRRLGYMNDRQIIDSLLNTDLAGLPQKPIWADGSGLSRYNLFTPQDFVWLLDKMQSEFGLARMERILPTGGNGTLGSYFKQDSGFIFAKTGSLSGVIALSGYLITKKNRLLIFSVLVNNYTGRPGEVRRAVQQFIEAIIEKE